MVLGGFTRAERAIQVARHKAGDRTIGIWTYRSNGEHRGYHPLTDPLGSTDAVSDHFGQMISFQSFEPYGKRRDAGDWTGPASAADDLAIANTGRRGYTRHTMLDNLALVHMNGRIFDPTTGRFMSGDPSIDGELDPQGWNRYSYVKNNPLAFTDPTGFASLQDCLRNPQCNFASIDLKSTIKELKGTWSDFLAWNQRNAFQGSVRVNTINARVIDEAQQQAFQSGNFAAGVWANLAGFGVYQFGPAPETYLDLAMQAGAGATGVALSRGLGAMSSRMLGAPSPSSIGGNAAKSAPQILRDVVLRGGRGGQNVKNLVGPPNSVVRGGGERAFITNERGQVVLDVTRDRVKPVAPGEGFGLKRPPTQDELRLLDSLLGGGP